jgi:hypothetical protein
MKTIKSIFSLVFVFSVVFVSIGYGQQPQASPRSGNSTVRAAASPQPSPQRTAAFDLSEYGVSIQPDARLIVMMAALEAAGFEAVPANRPVTAFRSEVRRDLANLDTDLRTRLRDFYERNKLPAPATPAEQAARYVSLAFALGPAPAFDTPARTDDLPEGVLQVLDFAPILRDFYRRSGIAENLPRYTRSYQAQGDSLRGGVEEMLRATVSYLRTRPQTTITERIPISNQSSNQRRNQSQQQRFTVRERERRFVIVPDLLAASGAINFRVIADDYFAVLPPTINPSSSELRRAYLLYLVDPLIARFNRDIAARRTDLRALIDARATPGSGGNTQTPALDVFTAVARSVVAATDARMTELARLNRLARETSARLQAATTDAGARTRITAEAQTARTQITDEAIADLADAYERGAILAFYFADQLRGVESSGFDIANSFADMIQSFDAARERNRLTQFAAERERGLRLRREREARAATEGATAERVDATRAALIESLTEVEGLLRRRDYRAAETRLQSLLREFQGEPRVHFALAQAASLAAEDAPDATVQEERLNRALAHYRLAIAAASPDTDRALISRAHVSTGRILAFLERNAEAIAAFDAAIALGTVEGGSYAEAVAERRRISP